MVEKFVLWLDKTQILEKTIIWLDETEESLKENLIYWINFVDFLENQYSVIFGYPFGILILWFALLLCCTTLVLLTKAMSGV